MSDQPWMLKDSAHPMTVSTLIDCVMEIGGVARSLGERKEVIGLDGGWRMFQAIVRQISVPLRKLLIDNEGSLLKGVILNPSFHRLGGTKGRFRQATIRWQTPRREWTLEYENGKKENVVVPEWEHEIEIGRLYGVEFLEDGWCMISRPFDLKSEPVEMDDWLNMKALQVNSVGYSVKDAIKLVADYEGAHTNDLPAFIAVGVNPEDIDRGRNMKFRLANSVYFGCLSYVQLLALYTGLYVIRKMQELIAGSGSSLKGIDIKVLAKLIQEVEINFSGRARIVQNCHEMIIAGKRNATTKSRKRRPAYRLWSGSKHWDAPDTDKI